MDILKNLTCLPIEIVEHEILSFLNGKQLLFTNKTFYENRTSLTKTFYKRTSISL